MYISEREFLLKQFEKQGQKKNRKYRIISWSLALLLVCSLTLNIQLFLDKTTLIKIVGDYQWAIISGETDLVNYLSNKTTLTRQEAEIMQTIANELNKRFRSLNEKD